MTEPEPVRPVPPPQKPPSSGRRVAGVFLGIVISIALSFVCGFGLAGLEAAFDVRLGAYVTLGLAFAGPQILIAVPLTIWLWRRDLKATALSLAICSALTFLVSGVCWGGVLFG